MAFTYRDGKREALSLLLALAGGTGSGKTYSAFKLAKGMAGGKKFAVVDTENGRANYYADDFDFAHGKISAPFRPDAYIEAIQTFDNAGFPVIVVDSASHEYAGEGGILEWHDELVEEFTDRSIKSGDNRDRWQIEESHNMRAWIEPKTSHKAMMARLLQVKAHVIFCFRAEPKTEIAKEKDRNGKMKTVIREKQGLMGYNGWFPICDKNMPFEMTTFLLLEADVPGFPVPITLREPHRPFFTELKTIDGVTARYFKVITEETGRQMAEWARGGVATTTTVQAKAEDTGPALDKDDLNDIDTAVKDAGTTIPVLMAWLEKNGYTMLEKVPQSKKASILNWCAAKKAARL